MEVVKDLVARLPHGPHAYFVSRPEVDGHFVSARMRLDPSLAIVQGDHFPGRPTLMGIFIVEAMAQVAGLSLATLPGMKGMTGLWRGNDRLRFSTGGGLDPNTEVTVFAEPAPENDRENLRWFNTWAEVGGKRVVRAFTLLYVTPLQTNVNQEA